MPGRDSFYQLKQEGVVPSSSSQVLIAGGSNRGPSGDKVISNGTQIIRNHLAENNY